MLEFALLKWIAGAALAAFAVLGGLFGLERRRNRKLEAEHVERLNAMAKAQVEAQQRRDEAVKNMPPIPDERPARFDDFERGG